MEFTKKLEVLREKRNEINRLKNEISKFSSGLFEEFYKYIFDKYPTLESFGWSQYTPYFNDGESCVFYANTDYISINGECVDDSDWVSESNVVDWGNWNNDLRKYEGRVEEPNPNYDSVLTEASKEITDFLSFFDNDFYLNKFGDHAEITVSRSGVDISDCEHD